MKFDIAEMLAKKGVKVYYASLSEQVLGKNNFA